MTHAAETINKKSNGSVYGLGFGNSSFDILGWWCDVMVRPAGSPGGSGGQDLRTGKYVFGTDRNYTDWVQLMLDWKSKGYFYPSSLSISDEIARAYFERGRFGMTVGGVWNQPEWTDHKFTDYSLTTLVGPDPKPKGYFYSTPGNMLLGISATSKMPDLAWEWLKWVYSPAAGKRWTQEYNEDLSVYPANNDPAKIKFKPFADFVALEHDCIPGPSASLRNPAISQVVIEAITPNFAATLTGLYSGQVKDATSAFKSVDEQSERALDKGLAQAKRKGLKVSRKDYVFADWNITKPYKYDIPKYPS
jgi:ABC-type glycerol-3-phosphate transport system substrate-binding protein